MSMSFPTTGAYGSVMQAYFGAMTDNEKQRVWDSFLTHVGLPDAPADTSKLDEFLQFVEGTAGYMQQNVVSPHEIEKRLALIEAINFVLSILNTLQDTVAVQSQDMIFLAKLQQEYTKMLTKTPVYVGAPTKPTYSATDPTKFTFGYNDISVDDIAGYMASGDDTDFVVTNAIENSTASLKFHSFYNNSGDAFVEVKLGGVVAFALSADIVDTDTFDQKKQKWSDLLMETLTTSHHTNSIPTFGDGVLQVSSTGLYTFNPDNPLAPSLPLGSYHLFWRYTEPYPDPTTDGEVDSAKQMENSNASVRRGEINSQLQQFITSTRARRKGVQTETSTMQAAVASSKEAINQQVDLFTSLMKSWNGIISSIFK